MAVDKLVDSTQLDADLTSVANAIRTKGGTSAQLAFPAGFVSAVEAIETGGGDPLEMARKIVDGTIISYVDDSLTNIKIYAFNNCSNMTEFKCHNVINGGKDAFIGTQVHKLALPRWTSYIGYAFENNRTVYELDLTDAYRLAVNTFNTCTGLSVLVLRHSSVVSLANINVFCNSPFASGKAGGTLYVPQALIADYQAATNWSTILGYANNQILPIEGSIYETQYADGTPIPTA